MPGQIGSRPSGLTKNKLLTKFQNDERQFPKSGNVLALLKAGKLKGDSERGLVAFTKADCAKCHRFGATGSANGP